MKDYRHLLNFEKLELESLVYYSFKSENGLLDFENIVNFFKDKSVNQLFPEYKKCIRIYLSLAINSVKNEKSFSKLKLIKTYLRNTMSQELLTSLGIISIERDRLDSLNLDVIINDFVNTNSARKAKFALI